jgi:hypothetical protein
MYEADEAEREAWIASIDAVAALNPQIVVAGHKSVGRRTCRRTSRPASSTCATSPPSRRRAARWRTWSTACSSCMATATSRTPCGSRPEPKSLAGREPQRSGSFAARTDHPTAHRGGPGSLAELPERVSPQCPPHGTQRCQRTPDAVQRLSRADGPKAHCLPTASSRIALPRACWCALVEPSQVTWYAPPHVGSAASRQCPRATTCRHQGLPLRRRRRRCHRHAPRSRR